MPTLQQILSVSGYSWPFQDVLARAAELDILATPETVLSPPQAGFLITYAFYMTGLGVRPVIATAAFAAMSEHLREGQPALLVVNDRWLTHKGLTIVWDLVNNELGDLDEMAADAIKSVAYNLPLLLRQKTALCEQAT